MRSLDWASIRVEGETSQEHENSLEGRDEGVNVSITEHVNSESFKVHIDFLVVVEVSEGDSINPLGGDGLNLLEVIIGNQEPVFAEDALRLAGINGHSDIIGNSIYSVAEDDLRETSSLSESNFLTGSGKFSHINGDEVTS
jgi:hypothetical protein